MTKSYPILEFDPVPQAIIEPSQRLKPIDIPESCVLTFFQDEINKLNQNGRLRRIKRLRSEMGVHPVYALQHGEQQVALAHPGIGAPFAAAMLEEIIALGCRKFVVCGGAGVLDGSIEMGALLIVTAAVRDEGTSYHYLPPGREVLASQVAVQAIEKTLAHQEIPYQLTKTWTTDAIYRETAARAERRRSEGCLAVEMEAAALLAVAQFRRVEMSYILYAGDDISGKSWSSRAWIHDSSTREQLIRLAAEASLRL